MSVQLPKTRCAKTSDRVHIANQVLGDSPIDLGLRPRFRVTPGACVEAFVGRSVMSTVAWLVSPHTDRPVRGVPIDPKIDQTITLPVVVPGGMGCG